MRVYVEFYGCRDFIEVVDVYLRSCFLSFMNIEVFFKIFFRYFFVIIFGEDFYVKCEEQVFEVISVWVCFDLVL